MRGTHDIQITNTDYFFSITIIVIIYLALQLDLSPPMIVGDSMQPRSFPIFNGFKPYFNYYSGLADLRKPPKEPTPILRVTWLTMVLMVLFYALTVSIDMFVGISL